MMDLTIIIPTHNEEQAILKTLSDLRHKIKVPHQIIIIDDSKDNTKNLVRNYIKSNKNVSIISGEPNSISFAKALKIGFTATKTKFVVVVMADLCDDPHTIDKMYEEINKGWDVVCGSRYMKGGRKEGGPILQHYLSMFVCKSLQFLTGLPTSDVSNAFKMYRKKALKGVRVNPISGVEGSMEFLFQTYFFNTTNITEVPTTWRGRTIGKSKFKILHRTPQYLRIYLWALENSVRKMLGIKLKNFYA